MCHIVIIHVIFYNMSTKMECFQNNVIVGVPRPGPYYIYNYFQMHILYFV